VSRCPWAVAANEYLVYHDGEWGREVHDDAGLFERLVLEGFQSGLSWLTILRKRSAFRAAFADFDPAKVVAFDAADRSRLLADARIVRNRAKIDAAISNARAALDLPAGLAALVWSFAPVDPAPAPATVADVPVKTPESAAMAKELKRRGFVFVGAITAYALMQSCGLVDDHLLDCGWRSTGG
jgi:DNA-3-methyladenine glycosylase I